MRITRSLKTGLLLIWIGGLFSSQAWACEVCYGAAESPMLEGMSASVLFMLATTWVLLILARRDFFSRTLRLVSTPAATR